MCIIIYKPEGKQIPKKSQFQHCWEMNQDGAGIAVFDKDREEWNVIKGFMTFDDFWRNFKLLGLKKKDCFVIHFRVGTSGWIDEGNTHPFPVTNDYDKMRQTAFTTTRLAIHNGTVAHPVNTKESDTMQWIKKYVYPLHPYMFADKELDDIVDELLKTNTNRWFIAKKNTIIMLGDWHDGDGGIIYSNKYWKEDKNAATKRTGKVAKKVEPVKTIQTGAVIDQSKNQSTHSMMFGTHAKDMLEKTGGENGKSSKNGNAEVNVSLRQGDKSTAYVDEHGNVTWDNPNDEEIVCLSCPNCGEDSNFRTSDFNVGNTICSSCGAVFDDNTGAVFTYDAEVFERNLG